MPSEVTMASPTMKNGKSTPATERRISARTTDAAPSNSGTRSDRSCVLDSWKAKVIAGPPPT